MGLTAAVHLDFKAEGMLLCIEPNCLAVGIFLLINFFLGLRVAIALEGQLLFIGLTTD